MFKFGDQVTVREHSKNRIWTARPMTVVQDTDELLIMYMAPDSIMKYPRHPKSNEFPEFLREPWILADERWSGGGALYFSRPRSHYAVAHVWSKDFKQTKLWYVNLQTPFVRTAIGFDYLDQALDVVISADLKTWHWKDVVEFEELQEVGTISRDDGDLMREVGLYVIANYKNDKLIFNEEWRNWRPPASWTVPVLKPGWDVV